MEIGNTDEIIYEDSMTVSFLIEWFTGFLNLFPILLIISNNFFVTFRIISLLKAMNEEEISFTIWMLKMKVTNIFFRLLTVYKSGRDQV